MNRLTQEMKLYLQWFLVFMFGIFVGQYSVFYFIKKKKKKNQRILIEIDTTFGNYELTIANSKQQTHSSKVKKEK